MVITSSMMMVGMIVIRMMIYKKKKMKMMRLMYWGGWAGRNGVCSMGVMDSVWVMRGLVVWMLTG